MTAEEALSSSNGEFTRHLIGYLPAEAAYTLVATGKYDFFCLRAEGYILKRCSGSPEDAWPVDTRRRPGVL